MSRSLVEMAADIVQSQCASATMTADEIKESLQQTFSVLQSLQKIELTAGTEPPAEEGRESSDVVAVAPEKSIQKNRIICLECGQSFTQLSPKHLASHGLSGRDYRKKYGFSLRQPLCARALTERRKKAGKDRGVPENLLKAIAARRKKTGGKGKAAKE
ncbi:MAG: MucR family transcriptional regulator [Thermodesulfobacteriota bacterium]